MQLTYFCGSHFQCANASNPRALQVTHNGEILIFNFYPSMFSDGKIQLRNPVQCRGPG